MFIAKVAKNYSAPEERHLRYFAPLELCTLLTFHLFFSLKIILKDQIYAIINPGTQAFIICFPAQEIKSEGEIRAGRDARSEIPGAVARSRISW